MIGASGDNATYANLEGRRRDLVTFTYLPWSSRIEAVLDAQFPRGVSMKVALDGLQRGDASTRGPFLAADGRVGHLPARLRAGPRGRPAAVPRAAGGSRMTETTSVIYPIEWRAVSTDERIVSGIAVPWNETSYLTPDPKGERFLPGSLTRTIKARGDRLKLFRGGREHQHESAIARPIELDARHPDGLWASWRIGRTPAGDAALAEVAEGLLDAFSVGFRAIRTSRGAGRRARGRRGRAPRGQATAARRL